MLENKTIIVGVTGGIAAYKTCEVVSRLKKLGAEVWVVMTKEAAQLVGPLTFRTLSGNPVVTDLFAQELLNVPVPHVALAQKADLVLIAPGTANIIGKLAAGIADDPLTTIVMAAQAVKLIAPAMNCEMWRNPIVKENINKLKSLGYLSLGPAEGKLACGEDDIGRMSEPAEIVQAICDLLVPKQDLKGQDVLVTAGGTREALDPVRYLSNRSSGRMGYALAEAARQRGATVTLIAANIQLPAPLDIKVVKVESAGGMLEAVLDYYNNASLVIMAAAVADFKPSALETGRRQTISKMSLATKIKKSKQKIKMVLEPTVDILKTISQQKGRKGRRLIGFALETDNLLANAEQKLREKNLDLIVANDQTSFDKETAKVVLIFKNGKIETLPELNKKEIANRILDAVLRL